MLKSKPFHFKCYVKNKQPKLPNEKERFIIIGKISHGRIEVLRTFIQILIYFY